MTAPVLASERRFLAALGCRPAPLALESHLQTLAAWLTRLQDGVATSALPLAMGDDHPLTAQSRTLRDIAQGILDDAAAQWERQQASQALATHFDDRLILLMFGKFNAGKSALCNDLADRLAACGESVHRFRLVQGDVVRLSERFAEGATETTDSLQGVEIGDHLVVIDTPGLHSVSVENARLAELFTDSADAVLWLSASTSPGQVQELDALARELQRHKPLLPIITRSDVFEEDEIDGRICSTLRNKTAENRALQERDVSERARLRLQQLGADVALLRPALSLSVFMARQTDDQDVAGLRAAGLDRWFDALADLAASALAYKRRKPAEVLLHHLQEQVQAAIDSRLLPGLAELRAALQAERGHLHACAKAVGQALWRSVMPRLAGWIDAAAPADPCPASRQAAVSVVCAQLLQQTEVALQAEWARWLEHWRADLPATLPGMAERLQAVTVASWPQADWAQALYLRLSQVLQACVAQAEMDRLLATPHALIDAGLATTLGVENDLRAHGEWLVLYAERLRNPASASTDST